MIQSPCISGEVLTAVLPQQCGHLEFPGRALWRQSSSGMSESKGRESMPQWTVLSFAITRIHGRLSVFKLILGKVRPRSTISLEWAKPVSTM